MTSEKYSISFILINVQMIDYRAIFSVISAITTDVCDLIYLFTL